MEQDLQNKKVYVSGTSKGIGHHIAREVLQRGAQVVGTSYHTSADVVLDSFTEFGKAYHHFQYDAAEYGAATDHLWQVREAFGGNADFNVFNAAEIVAVSPELSGKEVGEAYKRLFAVNITGPVALAREHFRQAGLAHKVVNVFFGTIGEGFYDSFQTGPNNPGVPSMGPYIETKAAISSYATQQRLELALFHAVKNQDGPRVLLVKPQLVETDLGNVVCRTFGMTAEQLGKLTPSQKAHSAEDVAREVVQRMLEAYNRAPGTHWGDPHIPHLPTG